MKKILRMFFQWIFSKELSDLRVEISKANTAQIECRKETGRARAILGSMDVSVDVHEYGPSWAAISIQGKGSDYIKFVELGRADIIEIHRFLKQFERSKIDASPRATEFLRLPKEKINWRL